MAIKISAVKFSFTISVLTMIHYCVCFCPGEGPFPAVLDLSTFMFETRGCLLANRGFVVLAVAVFNGKPNNVKEIHLDYFKEAVDFLQQQPKVSYLNNC